MRADDASSEIHALLKKGMGPNLHWFPADVSVSRLAAVMAGMANTQGGAILIGVAPRSTQVLGIPDPDAALDELFQAALLIDPPIVIPMPQVVSVSPGKGDNFSELPRCTVLKAVVPAGLPNVYRLDGRFLGRDGAQTNPLPARKLRQLLVERGAVQFERLVPPGVSTADLDAPKVAAYAQALGLSPADDPLQALVRRGCLRPPDARTVLDTVDRDRLHPTYAALLLFGCQPERWLPSAGILMARFTGNSLADQFIKQDIHGPLPDQLRMAEAFLRDHLPTMVYMQGLEHVETPIYPLEALRELLVNAVAHRDYNLQGDSIHVNIFSDRIEIHSPGGLPGPMPLDNLLEARFSRNPVILQVLADMGFVERLGYGLNRVMEVTRKLRLRPPRFEEIAGSFRATLYAPDETRFASMDLSDLQGVSLNPRQQQAIFYLRQNRRITNREYQELCPDVHSETLRRDLSDLVERGLLIKIGDKRATYYILKK